MMSTVMEKNGLESGKLGLQKNKNQLSSLKHLPGDIYNILQGNTVPKSDFKLDFLSSQRHVPLSVKDKSNPPIDKDIHYPYKYQLPNVDRGKGLHKEVSKEFAKIDKDHEEVLLLSNTKATTSAPVETTSATPPGHAEGVTKTSPTLPFATTTLTRLILLSMSPARIEPGLTSASVNALSLSTFNTIEEEVPISPTAVSKGSFSEYGSVRSRSTLLSFSALSNMAPEPNSMKPSVMARSAALSQTISYTPVIPPTSSSLSELHPLESPGGSSLEMLVDANFNSTPSSASRYTSRIENKASEDNIYSRTWKTMPIKPAYSTTIIGNMNKQVKQSNISHFLYNDDGKPIANMNSESLVSPSAVLASIFKINGQLIFPGGERARNVNLSNSSSLLSLETHEFTSRSATNYQNGNPRTPTMAPLGSAKALNVGETQSPLKKRPLCMYPPVPVHGTFNFRTIFNPEPDQFRYYIQYTCYPGYAMSNGDIYSYCLGNGTWSGVTPVCLEFSPCSINNGGCSQLCKPTQQKEIVCGCREGFQLLDDERTCKDIDECATGSHQCHQSCTNTFGSYKCSCRPGFRLEDDESTCNDLDECTVSNGGCSHHCANTFGSSMCYCPTGYEVDVDQKSCRDINECLLPIGTVGCPLGCVNAPGSFQCNCPDGYRLSTNSWYCVDINECLDMERAEQKCEWKCVDLPGSFLCVCPRGYRVSTDRYHCVDVDECTFQRAGCSHSCVNTPGGYRCECPNSHELSPYSKKTCRPLRIKNIRIKEGQ
ncbi:uncharacterized protein [Ambystoma mexicanum]|uniref:uncharacterized protein n=1 Tax=Ambystoma mexicanum TaxID=8296 RepID=UPI0037E7AAF5